MVFEKGYKPTTEHLRKLRESHKGNKSHLGFKNSEESKRKMSESAKRLWNNKNGNGFKKGHTSWCKEKTRPEHSKIMKKLYANGIMKGNKGMKHTKEWLEWRKTQIIPIKDTSIELKIQSFLSLLHIEYLAHKYISEITHSYQCDIFIPSLKLIIETDGCYWHGCPICYKNPNEWQDKQIKEDKIRNEELREKGYKVIRLWEHEINSMQLNDFQKVLL